MTVVIMVNEKIPADIQKLSFEDAEGFSVSYFIADDFYTSRIETHLDLYGEKNGLIPNREYMNKIYFNRCLL